MSRNYFQEKKCFITGAASGIGRATALLLAQKGAELFLTDIHTDGLEKTVRDIRFQNGKVSRYKALDIVDYEAVRSFAQEIYAESGAMDIVMNIAGIAVWGAVDQMKHEDWKAVIDVNLMGPIHVVEVFVPEMMKNNSGHIVNVTSAAGLFGLPWHGAYSASKYGLRGLSDVLRHDLKKHKIGVHLVCPGAVDTGLVQSVKISGLEISEEKLGSLKKYFQKHAVSPEQAAKAILKGIENKDYYIFTSEDIRLGFLAQQKFTTAYDFVMQKMNDVFQKAFSKD